MFEIGSSLTEARLRRGLDIAECELQTKIRAKYLRAMENDEFDALPAPAYIRGFLRSYAEFLGLDGDLMLDEYESREPLVDRSGDGDSVRRRAAASGSRAPRNRPGRRRSAEGQLLAAALTGVLCVSALVWVGVSGRSKGPVPISKARPPGQAAVPGPVTPPNRDASRGAFAIVVRGLSPQGSYLQVRSVSKSGRTVFDGILAPGDQRRWRVKRGLWMTVGRTEGVELAVDDAVQSLEGGSASFQLSKAGIVPTEAGG
jgi:cytoskeleton protein RodZ